MATRRFFVDVAPLKRSPQLRLLVVGESVTSIGRQLTAVAAPIQVFALTESTLAVGLLGLVQFPALVLGSFVGGAVADAFDRRRVLLVTHLALAVTSAGLALNADASRSALWLVYALASMNAMLSGIDYPARSSSIPRLVAEKLLAATYALRVLVFQTAGAIGPALAGIIIADLSVGAAFWFDTAAYGVSLTVVSLMRPIPPQAGSARPSWKSLLEGFRFIRGSQELQGVYLIDIVAMIFGMPRALFPEMGSAVFGGGARAVGYLYAAPGVGAMLAGITSGWVGHVRKAGRATIVAVVVWGAGIVVFGLATALPIALIALLIAGAGDAISTVFRSTILQTTTPDELRGRTSAVQIATVSGGPRIGDAEAGLVASAFGVQVAAWTGGILSIIGALAIGRLFPRFRHWEPPHSIEEPEAE